MPGSLPTHCQLRRGKGACNTLLVVVPDHKGKGHTIACPHCDDLHKWPSHKKRKQTKRTP